MASATRRSGCSAELRKTNQLQHLQKAFSTIPDARMSPADAYQALIRGRIERVALPDLAGRTLATSVVPYPPGIPMMMPARPRAPPTALASAT